LKIKNWKQTGSLETYIHGILSIAAPVLYSLFPEEARALKFIHNIQPELGKLVSSQNPTTIHEAISIAEKLDGLKRQLFIEPTPNPATDIQSSFVNC